MNSLHAVLSRLSDDDFKIVELNQKIFALPYDSPELKI